jgi:CRISPR-associated endoribonuclease Cas6
MPYSLVLHCLSRSDALTPEDLQGQKTLAFFLQELIHKQDAGLAARLHAPRNSKPFTTAILAPQRCGGVRPPGAPTVRHTRSGERLPEDEVKIRFTLLDDALYPLVSQFFLQHLGNIPVLHLGGSPLIISRVTVTPESGEPWAGFASFDDLLAQVSGAETSWIMRFATPTAFKSGDADVPLPVPRLCFQSWLNSWDEHSPYPFFTDKAERRRFLEEVVEGQVSVHFSQIRAAEQGFYFDGHRTREQGFTGTCIFSVKLQKTTPHQRRILTTLAHYSFFASTGRKTTMGMGVTRLMNSTVAV